MTFAPKTYRLNIKPQEVFGCLGSLILGIVWGGGIKQTANVSGQIMVNSTGSVPNIAKKSCLGIIVICLDVW